MVSDAFPTDEKVFCVLPRFPDLAAALAGTLALGLPAQASALSFTGFDALQRGFSDAGMGQKGGH